MGIGPINVAVLARTASVRPAGPFVAAKPRRVSYPIDRAMDDNEPLAHGTPAPTTMAREGSRMKAREEVETLVEGPKEGERQGESTRAGVRSVDPSGTENTLRPASVAPSPTGTRAVTPPVRTIPAPIFIDGRTKLRGAPWGRQRKL